MNAPFSTAPFPTGQASQAESPAERTARHLATCRELMEASMQLARATAAQILNPPLEAGPPAQRAHMHASTLGFLRLAAMIHKTIALEIRLADGEAARFTPVSHALRAAADAPGEARAASLDAWQHLNTCAVRH